MMMMMMGKKKSKLLEMRICFGILQNLTYAPWIALLGKSTVETLFKAPNFLVIRRPCKCYI